MPLKKHAPGIFVKFLRQKNETLSHHTIKMETITLQILLFFPVIHLFTLKGRQQFPSPTQQACDQTRGSGRQKRFPTR